MRSRAGSVILQNFGNSSFKKCENVKHECINKRDMKNSFLGLDIIFIFYCVNTII